MGNLKERSLWGGGAWRFGLKVQGGGFVVMVAK
jgi:hypothetical protein